MTEQTGFPAGRAVALDDRVRIWPDVSVVLGGAPWTVLRIAPAGRGFLRRLRSAGPTGAVPADAVERRMANLLLARGIVHPVARGAAGMAPDSAPDSALDIVVPAYRRPAALDACLASLRAAAPDAGILVVDDASPDGSVAGVAAAHGARVVTHPGNRGPAAARNTGLRHTNSVIVAFVDSDCAVTDGWLDPLLAHFDDPRVGAVAPRIVAQGRSHGVLARYEGARCALDMGPRPALVAPGAPLGYLPSAALLVRRSAIAGIGFDEDLRLGEDVDLVWRLVDAGWMVRYEPSVIVHHESRPNAYGWARQVFGYGTSAADLDRRHPGRLAPARLSGWNVAIAGLLLAHRPSAGLRVAGAAAFAALAAGMLSRPLRSAAVDPRIAGYAVGKGMLADAAAAGHLLRREWWPLGWAALAGIRRRRVGRAAAAAMIIPPVMEWVRQRPPLGPLSYLGLRLVEDAAYGSGAIAGAVRRRRPGVLLPRVRLAAPRRSLTTVQSNQARLP